jgi:hypothetical protein
MYKNCSTIVYGPFTNCDIAAIKGQYGRSSPIAAIPAYRMNYMKDNVKDDVKYDVKNKSGMVFTCKAQAILLMSGEAHSCQDNM